MKTFRIDYPKTNKNGTVKMVSRFVSSDDVNGAIRTIYPNLKSINWRRKSIDYTCDEYIVNDGIIVLVYIGD